MKIHLALFILVMGVLLHAPVQAQLKTQTINYEQDGTSMTGYLAYDDAVSGKRPAVLVVHEWWGLNDYIRRRAEQLAGLGYVAFAVDMYGQGKQTRHPQQAGEWSKEITQNKELWRKRASAGLEVLKKQSQTDPERVAAIGYCFGGGTVQQLAYSGADIKGIASFHGSLQEPPADAARQAKAKFLILHGAADSFAKPEQVQSYQASMAQSGLDYQVIVYGGAKHGFTNPQAGEHGIPALAYDGDADRRSWAHMRLFFDELFSSK
ncbi:MAG: dienelactone hydrolase family protein [Desulfobacteraceae bacterium]|nr:MAG: dienelactone hydrolase family protein [Desulfobacteraceae bacterium]